MRFTEFTHFSKAIFCGLVVVGLISANNHCFSQQGTQQGYAGIPQNNPNGVPQNSQRYDNIGVQNQRTPQIAPVQQPPMPQHQPMIRETSPTPSFQQTAPPNRNINNTANTTPQKPYTVQPNAQYAGNQNVRQAVQNTTTRGVNRQVHFLQDEVPEDISGFQTTLPQVNREQDAAQVSGSVQLRKVKPIDFYRKLVGRLGERCVQMNNLQSQDNRSIMKMKTADGSLLEVNIDLHSGLIQMTGTKQSITGFAKIVKLIDIPDTDEQQTDLAPYSQIHYRTVQQVINALEQDMDEYPYDEFGNTEEILPFTQPGGLMPGQNPNTGRGGVGIMPSVGSDDGLTPIERARQSGLFGQVTIEVIDGMEAIVLRGPVEEVARVRELIRQIEEAGAEQEPKVVIHPMQNTDCTRIGTLVRLLYNEVYGTRRGSINITPLVKPNALLLIGKKESIETAIELINKLDFPVNPAHEFKYIQLRNASPTTVKNTIDEFIMNRAQLGTIGTITIDARRNAVMIFASPRDLKEIERMIKEMDNAESEAVSEVKVFALLNSNVTQVVTMLQNAFSGTTTGGGGFTTQNQLTPRNVMLELQVFDAGIKEVLKSGIISASDITFTANANNNSLLVKAPKDCMDLITAIIKQIDQLPAAESQVKVFKIVNGDANALYTMLQTLFQTTTGGAAGNNTLVTRPGFEEGESSMIQVRFSVDVRSNSIIATGSAGDLNVVEAILFRLDEEEVQERRVYVFRLLNARSDTIVSTINNYLTSERSVDQIDNQLFSVKEQFRREVVVVEDSLTNSLIVSCTPRFYQMISRLISHLDTRPPMVVIQVLIAEITLNNMREFGVELGLQDSILFDRSVNGAPGFNFNNQPLGNNTSAPNPDNVGSQGLTNLGVGRTGSSGYGGFVFSASSESVSVLIRALEERQKVDILSRPEVTAMHNQRATIQVGQQVPYGASVVIDNSIMNNTEYKDVGVILDVTPRISDDDIVSLFLYVEKSSAAESTGGLAPRITVSKLQTSINALDGQTVVIGGLITNDTTTTTRAVPFVSRIPVVGRLFEYNLNRCERKEMIVIMTPTIIRSKEDMDKVQMQEINRIHWCIQDVATLIDAKNLRKRGEYYNPTQTKVVTYDGFLPEDSMLPEWKRLNEISPHAAGMPHYEFNDQIPTPPDMPLQIYHESQFPMTAPPEPSYQRRTQ